MPILDIGYRKWEGERSPAWTRAFVVATTGVSLVWRGAWMKRLLMLLVLPSIIAAIFVGVFEQMVSAGGNRQDAVQFFLSSRTAEQLAVDSGLDLQDVRADPKKARHFVWSYILFTLFRYPQSLGMVLLVGLIAPRLISYDLRSRGYLLYLSRPLTPGEYVAGKAGVLCVLLLLAVTLPALVIYMVGLCLSTDSTAFLQTWDIPLRILVSSVLLILPTSAIALALSSLTQESRYAGFSWYAVWILGEVTYLALWGAQQFAQAQAGGRVRDPFRTEYSHVILFSPYESLGYLQKQVFQLLPSSQNSIAPWILMICVTLVGYGIAYWRVSRMLKA
jgi:ABC-2 type transport system permease protein